MQLRLVIRAKLCMDMVHEWCMDPLTVFSLDGHANPRQPTRVCRHGCGNTILYLRCLSTYLGTPSGQLLMHISWLHCMPPKPAHAALTVHPLESGFRMELPTSLCPTGQHLNVVLISFIPFKPCPPQRFGACLLFLVQTTRTWGSINSVKVIQFCPSLHERNQQESGQQIATQGVQGSSWLACG